VKLENCRLTNYEGNHWKHPVHYPRDVPLREGRKVMHIMAERDQHSGERSFRMSVHSAEPKGTIFWPSLKYAAASS
jgi:hypothetical protein